MPPAPPSPAPERRRPARALLASAALAALALLALRPALSGGWLWDDDHEVVDNWILKDPAALARIWLRPSGPDYFPLKTTVQWLEWRAFGGDPFGYHAVSLALHLAAALLLWRVLRRLGARWAWAGGLLFAVHPLAVESAAWAAELKNTLSLCLMLLALLAWLTGEERADGPLPAGGDGRAGRPSLPWHFLALGLFLLALLAKSTVVMLPGVLLLLCWWRRGRLAGRDLARTAPFFALSLALGLVTLEFQRHVAIGGWDIDPGPPLARLEHAATALGFYAVKTVAPIGLEPLYSLWPADSAHVLFLAPFLLLAAAAGWAWAARRTWGRHVLLGLGCFVLNLLPVSGLVAMSYLRYARVADHFAYISLAGAAGLAAAGLGALARRIDSAWVGALAAVALGLGGGLARAHARAYRDSATLWGHVLARDPASWAAHYNLGYAEVRAGRLEDGAREYLAAIRCKPDLAEAHNALGYDRMRQGRRAEAEAELREALRLAPGDPGAHTNLGNLLAQGGDLAGAAAEHREALRLSPAFGDARINLANVLVQAGRMPEAFEQYRLGLDLRPDSALGHYNFGLALAQAGRLDQAVDELALAARNAPANAVIWNEWGVLLAEAGRLPQAEERLAHATKIDPRYAPAEANLARVLQQENQPAEAAKHRTRARELDPGAR